jgi:hypothetical protein
MYYNLTFDAKGTIGSVYVMRLMAECLLAATLSGCVHAPQETEAFSRI